MELRILDDIQIDKDACQKVGAFWYFPPDDSLYHESPWPFPVKLLIKENLSKCYVTRGFLKLPFILKGWINLDILMREIELLKMLQDDMLLLHASCVGNTLIVGFPNSGKTYQTYSLVRDGWDLVSEEYTIINKEGYAMPYAPVMRTCFSAKTLKDCEIKTNFGEKVSLALNTIRAKLMPFMFEAVIWKNIPVSNNPSKVKYIIYGSQDRTVGEWKELAILTENEFPFMASEFLQAYAFATGFDLIGLQEKQRGLIKRFVDAVNHTSKQG